MSRKTKFIYNGLLLTLVGFAVRAVGVFVGAYIAGAIGAEGVGLQGLISTVYTFGVTFATSGVSLSVTRLVATAIGEGKSTQRVMRGAFLYAFLFGAAACILLFAFADLIGVYVIRDMRSVPALRMLSLSLLPIALSGVISGYFVAVRRVALNAAVQAVSQVMRIVMTVFLLSRLSSVGIESAVSALALGTTLTESVCFTVSLIEYLVDRKLYGSPRDGGCGIGDVSRVALPLAFSAYVRSFLLSVEHSLIPKRLVDRGNSREDALSSYGYLGGMALPIILFPMTPLSAFSGLLVPEFAECDGANDRAGMQRIAKGALERALMYATAVAVFIFSFSESLGYAIYGTYEAGKYIEFLAPVIPLMYLDHVTDSMLKGIGEQVYSMWVNIADSFLSVILVWVLIPIFDISGYAIVIIVMELFNFMLSYRRLKRRISFRIDVPRALLYPLAFSVIAVICTERVFCFSGSGVSPVWIFAKIVFAICVFLSLGIIISCAFEKKKQK